MPSHGHHPGRSRGIYLHMIEDYAYLHMIEDYAYLHMIEDYARRNGHADLNRERIDGDTADWHPRRHQQRTLAISPSQRPHRSPHATGGPAQAG